VFWKYPILAVVLFVVVAVLDVMLPILDGVEVCRQLRQISDVERIEVAPVHTTDELGKLAASINALAVALEEAERRRLEVIGDVAHELRTPIATLEGYLEGLLDGVVEPTLQTWAMLHTEAGRLR
jgi:two-component system sensor histidine kinase BaeS